MSLNMIDGKRDDQILSEHNIQDFYINSVSFITSIYDIQMNLGIISNPEEPPKEIAIVRMSPQHAFAMLKLLEKHLQAYEEQFGKIPMPQELLDSLGEDE